MTSSHAGEGVLSAELEAIAACGVRAQATEDVPVARDAQGRVAIAASAAIAAGAALSAVADAESTGELRARDVLPPPRSGTVPSA